MPKKVTDEKLLEMLLVHGSVSGAATALGLSRNAIYKRMQDADFRTQYDSAQGVMLSAAALAMSDALCEAINTLLDVVRDKNAAASIRVSASDAILRHTARYIESADILRRLDALENQKI